MSLVVALAGNPNCGKSTLFNRWTGLRQRVGNYAGVTVERRSGTVPAGDDAWTLLDLPGSYSLVARSPDEHVAVDVLRGVHEAAPDIVVLVLDATNLPRHLYFALSVLELGRPTVVALNMIDACERQGVAIDAAALGQQLGVPVVPIVARTGRGLDELTAAVREAARPGQRLGFERLSPELQSVLSALEQAVAAEDQRTDQEHCGAYLLGALGMGPEAWDTALADFGPASQAALRGLATTLGPSATGHAQKLVVERHALAQEIARTAYGASRFDAASASDRIDRIVLHPVWGTLFFVSVLLLIFQTLFAWAAPWMDAIEDVVAAVQGWVAAVIPEGAFRDLCVDGVVGGVGNVLVFLPQIAALFFFIAILEDSGYLARAAFLADRWMARAGLHGRAFIPLVSGFACAVPAIMAARSIENRRDRLLTIMVTPLISCSARLPVYALMIATLFSDPNAGGFLSQGALILLSLYLLSVLATLIVAFVLKRTVLRGATPPLTLELPPYRVPAWRGVVRRVYERCAVFVRDAGSVILACSIVLWALLYFPRVDSAAAADQAAPSALSSSYAGRIGRAIEPAIEPLGFDWKIGVGLIASFAAREVFVSTMGLVYGIEDGDEESLPLRAAMRSATHASGAPVYTPRVGLSLMIFFVFACQCMSTVAVVRRETDSWRWPIFMVGYMTVLAWVASFVTYRAAGWLGMA